MSGGEEYRDIVERIVSEKGVSREDVERMVEAKIEEFGGIIGRDAAALMVAKSLGVEIESSSPEVVRSLKLSDLVPGFQRIEVEGVVVERMEPRVSRRGELFARLVLADETAAVPLVGWGEPAEKFKGLALGDEVVVSQVSVRRRGQGVEVFVTERSQVRVVGRAGPEALWSLSRRWGARTLVMGCVKAACSADVCCLYGATPGGEPVSLLIPEAREGVEAFEGKYVAASRATLRGEGTLYSRLYRGGVVDVVGEEARVDVEAVRRVFSTRGVVAGYVVFKEKGGRVFLVGEGGVRGVAVFNDNLFSILADAAGREVEAWGVRETARGPVLGDCAVVEDRGLYSPVYSRARLLGASGWVEVYATLLDASLYYRCGDRFLATLRCTVDDGTGRARCIVSGEKAAALVLGLVEEDLCGYEGVEKIIEYSVDEVRGRDFLFRGFFDPERGTLYALEVAEG